MAHPAAPTPRGLNRSFPAEIDRITDARSFVNAWFCEWVPDDDPLVGDVAVAVSEACTNAVVHAFRDHAPDRGDAAFCVAMERDGDTARVTVSDNGAGMEPRTDSPGLGLGLAMIASLTDGVEIRPATHGSGTIVAMRFSLGRPESRLSPGGIERGLGAELAAVASVTDGVELRPPTEGSEIVVVTHSTTTPGGSGCRST
jgi:serine/threonine-protein kinase RsbW